MQLSFCLRRAAAVLTTSLLLTAAAQEASARTQEANVVPVAALATLTLTDRPSAIRGNPLLASDGNIYFVSTAGGKAYGSIVKLAPDGTLSLVYAFATADEGYNVYAGLTEGADGNFYGTSYFGGDKNGGSIFKVTPSGTFTLLRSLGENKRDAYFPYGGVVQGPDGNLYGTTLRGGVNDKGTVFRISTSGSDFSIIASFAGSDGENPEGTLIVGADGNLYGTTLQGGSSNRGTIFRVTTGGSVSTVYSFPSLGAFNTLGLSTNETGANPRAGLFLAADGNYYGTAYQGGANGYGTVFRMTPGGAVSVVHAFTGAPFGSGFPLSGVTQDASGNLYGTTESGGYLNQGTAWRIAPDGTFSLLHSFSGTLIDGSKPNGTLVPLGGAIYGATLSDSVSGEGVIFKLDTGTGGVLPVEFSVSSTDIGMGSPTTLTWSSPTAASCASGGSWTDTVGTSGSLAVTPPSAGIYTYTLTCTDSASVARTAYTAVRVKAPAAQPVDAGGGGGGALSIPALLLLGALALRKKL
jgi:uncharacterized repeat protein (TIGR03803 family)